MNFNSPNKMLTPTNVPSPSLQKIPPSLMYMHQSLAQNIPYNKPGTQQMSVIIGAAANRIYSDFNRLTETIRSMGDTDRKKTIVKFLVSTRQLLIRVQALNKWTSSANKVDRCENISNLLDEQSNFLYMAAEELSRLARDRLPMARLPNFMPIIAADIFASKTYSRLPNTIRLPILRKTPITSLDKLRMFEELDRILRIRLSNSKIPLRMRQITIENGRVTFTVPYEFEVTLTVMSDHHEHNWRVLDVKILVQGNNVCRGRPLIHKAHLTDIHRHIQARMNFTHDPSYPSLFHLYDLLHMLCMTMQLEVLHDQINDYSTFGCGVKLGRIIYIHGLSLFIEYWYKNDGNPNTINYSLTVTVDEDDIKKPLKIKHSPQLNEDNEIVNHIVDYKNLSIRNILAQTLRGRTLFVLKRIQRLLFPFVHGSQHLSESNPILKLPILKDKYNDYHLTVSILPYNGEAICRICLRIDNLNKQAQSRVKDLLRDINRHLNVILTKSNSLFNSDQYKLNISESRELIGHRGILEELFSQLRVALSSLQIYEVLQLAGYRDLKLFYDRPALQRPVDYLATKYVSGAPLNTNLDKDKLLFQYLDREKLGECQLIFIPLNNQQNYLVIVCEMEFQTCPVYNLFDLLTIKVFTKSNSKVSSQQLYNENNWVQKAVKFSPISNDFLSKMINLDFQESPVSARVGDKRHAISSTVDILRKRLKLSDGSSVELKGVHTGKVYDNFPIEHLSAVVGYFRDRKIINLLNHELSVRDFRNVKIYKSDINSISIQIKKFPKFPEFGSLTNVVMGNLLKSCIVHYFVYPPEPDSTNIIKCQANFTMIKPVHLMKKTDGVEYAAGCTGGDSADKQFLLSNKRCVEENAKGISTTVDQLIECWKQMLRFAEYCVLPLLNVVDLLNCNPFRLDKFEIDEIQLRYGPNSIYKLTVQQSGVQSNCTVNAAVGSGAYTIQLDSELYGPNGYGLNPHLIILTTLEHYINRQYHLDTLLCHMHGTMDLLEYMKPFYNDCNQLILSRDFTEQTGADNKVSTLSSGVTSSSCVSVMSTNLGLSVSGTVAAQIVRKYILLPMDSMHLILIFHEKLALSIAYNPISKTIQLSDAHDKFHACNMSICPIPQFNRFMSFLEDNFNLDIEASVWLGCSLSQLCLLMGLQHDHNNQLQLRIDDNNSASSSNFGVLQHYLSACLALVSICPSNSSSASGNIMFSISLPCASTEEDYLQLMNNTNNNSNTCDDSSTAAVQQQTSTALSQQNHQSNFLNVILKCPEQGASPLRWYLAIEHSDQQLHNMLSKDCWILQNNMLNTALQIFTYKISNRINENITTTSNAILVFKRLVQLPSWKLQKNLLELISTNEIHSNITLDLDWYNTNQLAIFYQSQSDLSSIALRLVCCIKQQPCNTQSNDVMETQPPQDEFLNLPIILHYAAKSNQIALLEDICYLPANNNNQSTSLSLLGLDKQANELVVMDAVDTPLPSFIDKLKQHIQQNIQLANQNDSNCMEL